MVILSFIKDKWNLIIETAIVISTLLASFTVPPSFNPVSLYDQENFAAYSKFLVAAVLSLSLVPCYLYSRKKFVWRWWLAAIVLLLAGIMMNIYYSNFKSRVIVDTEEFGYGRLVKGVHYLKSAQIEIDDYNKRFHSYPSEKLLIAGFEGDHLKIWPKEEILLNSNKIVLIYMTTLVCFTLFIIFSVQALYCLSTKY